jgi:hypothetical protein
MTNFAFSTIGDCCPRCKGTDSLGRPWRGANGRLLRTCFKLNHPEHLGYRFHFDAQTGEALTATDGVHAMVLAAQEDGEAAPLRGFHEQLLAETLGITVISANKLDVHTASIMPSLGTWARDMEAEGYLISQFPIHRGPYVVGLQLRALRAEEDRATDQHHIRVFGQSEGLFIPFFIGQNPSAVVIHEGPWGAVAATYEAIIYGNTEIFSVATLSASVSASTIKSTLDAIFPGVPRFSLFDQDPAGISARMATMSVAKPILITGAGPGKDYRDLIPELRFERLVDIVERELKSMGLE